MMLFVLILLRTASKTMQDQPECSSEG